MASEYYILKPAVDTPETGNAYPSVESVAGYDFNSYNSVHKLTSNALPNFEPDIRFKLAKGAKLCNLMSQGTISAVGILVDDDFKKLLQEANTIPFKCFNAEITISSNNKVNYNWIQFLWQEGIDFLDFKQSKFKIKRGSKDLGDIDIHNYIDLQKKQGELGFIKMIHNYESTIKSPKFDLFTHPLNRTIYISDMLKRKFENDCITGTEITESDQLKMI